jgi:hypothetical protein
MCHDLIDYEFYLPVNVTQGNVAHLCAIWLRICLASLTWCYINPDSWNYYATLFGYGYDGALSTECREAIKRNVCQKLYMPCPENMDLDVSFVRVQVIVTVV